MRATASIAFPCPDDCELFCTCICRPCKIHLASPPSEIRAASASISASKSIQWMSLAAIMGKAKAAKRNSNKWNSIALTGPCPWQNRLFLFSSLQQLAFCPSSWPVAARNSWICSTEHLEVPLIYMKIDGICTRMLTNADIYSSLATSWACLPTALQKFNVLCLGCRFAFRFGLAFLCCLWQSFLLQEILARGNFQNQTPLNFSLKPLAPFYWTYMCHPTIKWPATCLLVVVWGSRA